MDEYIFYFAGKKNIPMNTIVSEINIQYGTCEDLIARHKLYTCLRTLARRYNTISVTHPLYF